MSVSNIKEYLINKLSSNDLPIYKEYDDLIIKNIYPKAKLIPRVKILNNKNNSENNEKKGDFYQLNKEFLFALVQPVFLLDKQKMYQTIANLIKKSKFAKKIENDSELDENINTLSITIAKNLSFMKVENNNNILYHIGENDDKFYFIIKGRITELKVNKYNITISFEDYISYLFELKRNNEIFILNEVLSANSKEVPIKSIDDIAKIYNVIFKKKLIEKISLEKISNNKELEDFFKQYNKEFVSFELSKKDLVKLEKNKNKIIMGSVNRDWDDYILEKCHPNSEDLLLFEPFEELYKNDKNKFIYYKFEVFSNLIEGDYFGDFSLDEDKIIRNETIRIEETTVLGYITNEDYVNIVSPSRKIEKQKEINLLNNSYFFKSISDKIFKKNYYEMFVKKEYGMNTVIFNSKEKPKSLIFLKEGKISLVINCSIIELYNLMQLIYIKLNKITWPYDNFQKKILSKEDLRVIEKKYFNEPILKKIKTFNKIFKFELEKKRKFQLALFSDFEIIGLEEIYLKMPYIAKGIVVGDKIICNELPLDKFNIILQEEIGNISESYVKASINRILSLMERLHNLKQNYINIARIKSETANIDNNILNYNKESFKNNYYNNNKTNNISSIKKNILNINNNKALIPQIFELKNKDFSIIKTENNDIEKQSFINSRLNSTKLKTRRIFSKIRKKNDRLYSSYRKITPKKNINNLKSASKFRSNRYELEKNEIISRIRSVDLYSRKIKKDKEKNKSSDNHIIIIGNTKINIKKLRKKINEYQLIDDIRKTFDENEKKKEIKDINLPSFDDSNSIKIKKENILKETVSVNENINYKKINKIKTSKTSNGDNNNYYISIINQNEYTMTKDEYTNTKESNNSLNYQNKKKDKRNYGKLYLNSISPMVEPLNTLNNRYIKNNKNIKPLSLNIENFKNKKKVIISNNTSNNVSIINQTSNTYSDTNNNISVLSIFPNIHLKTKINEYLSSTNSNLIKNYFNKKKSTGKLPEIVKNYYSQIKKRGYIPLIPNKETNTIFLRKYHKKYNYPEKDYQNKTINKNGNILPKINGSQTIKYKQ